MISREPIPIRSGRSTWRRILIVLGVVLVLLLLTLRQLATFWTDYLWFDSIDRTGVWSTLVWTRVLLAVVFSVVAFLLIWLNTWLADRLSPRGGIIPESPDQELLERYQDWMEPRAGRVRLVFAAIFGLLLGLGAGAWWEDYLLFTNSASFGADDPQFGLDIGFYVFDLPFLRDLFGWGFQVLVITTLIVAAIHYLNGGIQIQGRFQRVKSGVKLHLSVLLALLALLKAVGYHLDKYDLLYSEEGQVFGASYTDVNARVPALNLLILISLFAAVLLLVNIRFRGWTLPVVAFGLWLATSIIVGGIYPALVQRFTVEPDEVNKELPYVERNIEFTRVAFDLADVEVNSFRARPDLDTTDLLANQGTIDNLRLWDPSVLITTYRQLQELRTYYKFEDVDVDRYPLEGGGITQVMLAARELDQNNIPGAGWVNNHLVYTHGFGSVVSPANTVTREGQPDFLVRDIPPDNLLDDPSLDIDQPRIYFGEGIQAGSFVFVDTDEPEVDFPLETGVEAVAFNTYDGNGGVRVGDIFRRAAFALRFGDFNTLISGQLSGDSRVLMVRNIKERVQKLAPFLYPDSDPYLVVIDGRLEWVLDLYSITDRYPYSEPGVTARLDRDASTLPDDFNYIRNSVKVTIDAYDGDMVFYVIDAEDPVLGAYRDIFPSIFTDGDQMPETLRQHLRYPEDLFRVQSDMYNRYHVTDPRVFFTNGDPWAIARDPSTTTPAAIRDPGAYRDDQGPFTPMVPYYLLMRLPGDEELAFLMMQPFTPENRPNMVSFLVAKSGPTLEEFGQMIDFQLPRDVLTDGPGQVGARINQNPTVAREFTLLDQQGSEVIQGNMLVVPIEESVLYVQPVYISADAAAATAGTDATALPEFKFVIVVFGNTIVMEESIDLALTRIFGEGATPEPPPDDGEPPPDGEVPDTVADLIARANTLLEEADAALRDGDLATYAQKVQEAAALIQQANDLITGLEEPPPENGVETSG